MPQISKPSWHYLAENPKANPKFVTFGLLTVGGEILYIQDLYA